MLAKIKNIPTSPSALKVHIQIPTCLNPAPPPPHSSPDAIRHRGRQPTPRGEKVLSRQNTTGSWKILSSQPGSILVHSCHPPSTVRGASESQTRCCSSHIHLQPPLYPSSEFTQETESPGAWTTGERLGPFSYPQRMMDAQ